jgi:hypothetical protein
MVANAVPEGGSLFPLPDSNTVNYLYPIGIQIDRYYKDSFPAIAVNGNELTIELIMCKIFRQAFDRFVTKSMHPMQHQNECSNQSHPAAETPQHQRFVVFQNLADDGMCSQKNKPTPGMGQHDRNPKRRGIWEKQ